MGWLREACPDAIGYFIEHRDGLKTTMVLMTGFVSDFTYAGLRRDTGKVISCQMHLPMPPRISSQANFFNPLNNHIEAMVLTGRRPYPVERTLLTSGMTLCAVESLFKDGARIDTPEMAITYRAPRDSTFWRT